MAKDKNNETSASSGFSRRASLSGSQPQQTPSVQPSTPQPSSNFARRGLGLQQNNLQTNQTVNSQPQTFQTQQNITQQSQSNFTRNTLGTNLSNQTFTQNLSQENVKQEEVKQVDTNTQPIQEEKVKPVIRNLTSTATLTGLNQQTSPLENTLSSGQSNILNQEAITVGDDKPKKEKKKKKRSKLWIKLIIFFLVFCIFSCACGVAGYSIYQLVQDMNSDKVLTKIEINVSDGMEYKIKECKFEHDSTTDYTTTSVSKKDLSFYWVNNSKKTYELQITFDKNQYFRFSQYNIYNSLYTSESIYKVDFETLTPNFSSKFTLAEDGYYYLNKKSQISNQVTLIFSVEFNIPDYRQQFDGSQVREIIKIEQSANPNLDWGYYPYLF